MKRYWSYSYNVVIVFLIHVHVSCMRHQDIFRSMLCNKFLLDFLFSVDLAHI